MDAVKAKFKFRDNLPYDLQKKLCDQYGFRFYGRRMQEWLILEKRRPYVMGTPKQEQQISLPLVSDNSLTVNDKIELGRQMQAIKAKFHDPTANAAMIRFRIDQMCRTLNKAQKQFCYDWVERNVSAL